jgi:alkyl hydroperoxide reductase subunit D
MIQDYKESLPNYARDLKLNLGAVLDPENGHLSETQLVTIALACAYSTNNQALVKSLLNQYQSLITDPIIEGAKAASSIMAMNNVYYRFIHLVSDDRYQKMPAKLRMNIIANPGIDSVDFELASMAVSAINGCGLCMDSHAKTLEKHQVSPEAIQQAVKIAAVVNGLAQVTLQESA